MVHLPPQGLVASGTGGTIRLQAPGQAMNTTSGIRTPLPPTTQIVVPVSTFQQQQQQQQQQQAKPQVSVATSLVQQQSVPTNTPLTVQTTQANAQAANAAPSQMSPTTAKKKCKNFLSTLIRLANDQPEMVANNVKMLIQGLIVSIV